MAIRRPERAVGYTGTDRHGYAAATARDVSLMIRPFPDGQRREISWYTGTARGSGGKREEIEGEDREVADTSSEWTRVSVRSLLTNRDKAP